MSLRPEEIVAIAGELNRELAGGVVQKVYAPTTTRVYFEVRVPGRSVTMLVCSDVGAARISAVLERPQNPPTPPTWQSVLRRELTGAKLVDAEALPNRKTLLLHFTKDTRYLTLVLEVTTAPAIVLCAGENVLSQSIPTRQGLRVGHPWKPLDEHEGKSQPSRLSGERTFLRLAHAAEELLATVEQKTWVDARRAPLLAKLKKLRRTIEKVRAEADRSAQANALRREGELLTQNLYRLKRGEPQVTLTEYLEDGSTNDVVVKLDPRRTPQQEVEHRFHQYKRQLRGADMAKSRLVTLQKEETDLQAQLTAIETAPPEAPPLQSPSRASSAQQPLPPYREYVGHGGQRIWVGRGSAHNDALTFHVARPFHVWFHARGVPGAHVVVPVDKNSQLSPEALLDAAHLAVHNSDARGEPRAEVSYVPVKYVHKPKDSAPGAVIYTREKTLLLRFEPARLERLLSALSDP